MPQVGRAQGIGGELGWPWKPYGRGDHNVGPLAAVPPGRAVRWGATAPPAQRTTTIRTSSLAPDGETARTRCAPLSASIVRQRMVRHRSTSGRRRHRPHRRAARSSRTDPRSPAGWRIDLRRAARRSERPTHAPRATSRSIAWPLPRLATERAGRASIVSTSFEFVCGRSSAPESTRWPLVGERYDLRGCDLLAAIPPC
jgi:hypothetical protein